MKVWRADDQAPGARLEYFRHATADSIVPVDLLPADRTSFSWELRSADLGLTRIIDFTAPTGQVVRGTKLIRASDPELCIVRLQVSGHPVVEQADREISARPGDVVFVDLSRPVRVAGGAHHQISVAFSRALLPLPRGDTKDLAGALLPARHGALVGGLVRQIAGDLDGYAGPGAARLGTAVLDLTAAALVSLTGGDGLEPARRERVLMLRIDAFIERRLGDPGLTPDVIAAAHHISVRKLYRLFEAHPVSVAGVIRARRLERCHRDLTDPTLAGVPVGAIGVRWGFPDPARFSRAFSAEFGLPPGAYRDQVFR